MKKLIALVIGLLFVFALVGCEDDLPLNEPVRQQQPTVDSALNDADAPTQSGQQTEVISEETAKAAALEHAGLKESDVSYIGVDLDRDDGMVKYEIDFYHNGYEYDYEINAYTGDIISFDKDRD